MPDDSVQIISAGSIWNGHNKLDMSTTQVHTPRPAPQFFQQPKTFSTKKQQSRNGTPRNSVPPRPPVKSAPPISRIFPHKPFHKALPVSFKCSPEHSVLSPHYNEGIKDLYFEQCFEIECKLGAGSFGEVFKVRSKEDGKLYAIKRSREKFRGECDRRRKLEEVAKHEKLPPHPNCVGFVKAWEEKQHLYIQTELCKTSLSIYADQNHNIPEKLIWNYLVDLLMAVNHLHDHDLVHMDIKPENIFIADDNHVCKLGDFGLVLDLCSVVDCSEAQEGDPKYLAPELMQGKFGKPADVFSLGITILEMASDLDLPRGGDLWHQLRGAHLPEEFLLGITGDLKRIIRWMMDPDPLKRPTVSEVLKDPFISQIWKVRKRQRAIRHMGVTPVGLKTPPPPAHKERRITPSRRPTIEWDDNSFSDDEPFEEGISITNNSMGAPLDSSASSNNSMSSEDWSKDQDGFTIPSVPSRKAFTTPGFRGPRTFLSQGTESPVLSSQPSFFSSSPVGTPLTSPNTVPPRGFSPNDSITPNSSFHEGLMEGIAEARGGAEEKQGIEPKNLMDAFECASSEEEM